MLNQYISEMNARYNLDHVWCAAFDWYTFDSFTKKYHNLAHSRIVTEAIFKLTPEPSMQLLLAASWHDAVYIPGAGSDANERCSAAALNVAYHKSIARDPSVKTEENDRIILEAQRLIMNTAVSVHLVTSRIMDGVTNNVYGELSLLLDADLSSLALPYKEFLVNQEKIIKENHGTVPEHSKQSALFLRQFLLCREFIYHTNTGRALWEDKAKGNIRKYCQDNDVTV